MLYKDPPVLDKPSKETIEKMDDEAQPPQTSTIDLQAAFIHLLERYMPTALHQALSIILVLRSTKQRDPTTLTVKSQKPAPRWKILEAKSGDLVACT
jgi:hypothetical protein